MLARVSVLLPFFITVLEQEDYSIFRYEDSGYTISFLQPVQSPSAKSMTYRLKIDEREACQADILRLDFRKQDFDRKKGNVFDPDLSLILSASNSFIRRLRAVAGAARARELVRLENYHIEYLTDDGENLPKEEGLANQRGQWGFPIEVIILDEPVWTKVNSLDPNFRPMPWESLLLDAQAQLPNAGVSIVLANTALEVLIERVLDLVARDTVKPEALWNWINKREFWLREPSTAEKFGDLLKFIAGKSLKAEPALWHSFKELRDARNSFVHEGRPLIARNKEAVTPGKAADLIEAAKRIVEFVIQLLPPDKRPQSCLITGFRHYINVGAAVPQGHKARLEPMT